MRFGLIVIIIAAIFVTADHPEGQGAKPRPEAKLIGTRAKNWTVGPDYQAIRATIRTALQSDHSEQSSTAARAGPSEAPR